MRTLNSSVNKQITGRFVRPVYLLEIEYDDGVSYRFHSGDGGTGTTIVVNDIGYGNNWVGNNIKISGIGWDVGPRSTPTVTIQNMDTAMSSVMLNNDIPDRPIKLWLLYVYERQILTLAASAASGATTLSVSDPIPAEISASGYLDLAGAGTYDKTYTSRTTHAIVLGATLTAEMSAGAQIYIQGPGMAGAYGATDVVPLFSGVTNEIELDEKRVTLTMLPQSSKTQYVPNRYITKYNHFNWLPQTGTQIVWGNETFILERADY